MPASALSTLIATSEAIPEARRAPDPVDLLTVLATVRDPRKARGVRHRLVTVLAVAVCAVLAGARSFVAIAEWGADLPALARLRLGLGRRTISESTIRRLLCLVDPIELDTALCRWHAERAATAASGGPTGEGNRWRQIAMDGKTARGAKRRDSTRVHLFGAVEAATGIALGQAEVDVKSNEITAFIPLCKRIGVTGALITADAMHTQREHVEYLHSAGAHWILIAKGNQPTLHDQLRALPWRDVPIVHSETGKSHGRVEQRSLQIVQIAAGIAFPHAALAIRLTRVRAPRGARRQTQTVYAITDLTWSQIIPAEIAHAMRSHWHIENKVHWVRDVTFYEDHSQIRTGHAPTNMAALRNFAIGVHRRDDPDANIAKTCRHVSRHPSRALNLVL